MLCRLAGSALTGLLLFGSAASAGAGLEKLHRQVAVGSLVCFADHTHRGGSRPMPSRAAAYADAVRSWSALVAFEYGEAWANFETSTARQVLCHPTHGLKGEPAWTCTIASRPCRPRL